MKQIIQQIMNCLSISTHTFTLVFRSGGKAVLQIHGAESIDEARACATVILSNEAYEVVDGDITNGPIFHAWTRVGAQGRMQQFKGLSALTDDELERMSNQIEEVIDSPSSQDREQELQLREALDLAEALELEQIRRLIEKMWMRVVQARVQREVQ